MLIWGQIGFEFKLETFLFYIKFEARCLHFSIISTRKPKNPGHEVSTLTKVSLWEEMRWQRVQEKNKQLKLFGFCFQKKRMRKHLACLVTFK